jgi:hypothetical protein
MRSALVLIAGVLMILSAAAHGAAGWPFMRGELTRLHAAPDLIDGIAAGWNFGTAAMIAFGVITVAGALRLRRQDPSGVAAVRVIAACYVVYGLAFFLLTQLTPFFLMFVATGVLAGAPVLRPARRG